MPIIGQLAGKMDFANLFINLSGGDYKTLDDAKKAQVDFQLQSGNPYMGATVAGVMLLFILLGVLTYLFTWSRRIQQVEL